MRMVKSGVRSLCAAILIQAIKDRAMLDASPDRPLEDTFDTADSLDAWFTSAWCIALCDVLGVSGLFERQIDWCSASRRVGGRPPKKEAAHGT